MTFERILSFFTEHAPELLFAFVLWWAATAPAATPTPLQSPTPTPTLAPTPTATATAIPAADLPLRVMHIDDLYAASRGDAALLTCMGEAGGNSIAQGDCYSAWVRRWKRDWFGHPFQLTGRPRVFGTRTTNVNQGVEFRGSTHEAFLMIYGVPWEVMAAIPQPVDRSAPEWVVPRCLLMAGVELSGGGLSINGAPSKPQNAHCRWVE